jgi:hypothetical protein
MTTQYCAYVKVPHADHGMSGGYWKPLGPWRATEIEADCDRMTYIRHKVDGTSGYRRGAPSPTRISERQANGSPVNQVN